jgi:hypothetical protein
MSVQVRPHTRFAAALMAAGVVSAASVVSMPEHRTITADVANASAITDALSSFGKGVEVASSLVGIHVDATISVPFEATLALMAAQQHPELAPNVLSYLVQRFVNPAVGPPITAYPWLTEQTVALLASVLPYPLGPSATDPGLINEARLAFADAFNGVLGQLPDPLPGYHAVQDVMNNTALGGAVVAGQLAVRAPLYMAWSTVNYLGNLPVNVEASLESAIQTPSQIPGLISYLVHGLLSPDAQVGLFGQLLNNAVDPLTWLPAPIGYSSDAAVGLANQIRGVIAAAMNGVLSLLPTPVTPSALPSATAGPGQPTYSVDAGKGSATPAALPAASLAIADAVTLAPVDSPEKRGATTDSKVLTPVTSTTDDLVSATPVTPDTDSAANTTGGDVGAQAAEAAPSDDAGESEPKDGRHGAAKVRPSKDRVTSPSVPRDPSTSSNAEPTKGEAGNVSGGSSGPQNASASGGAGSEGSNHSSGEAD